MYVLPQFYSELSNLIICFNKNNSFFFIKYVYKNICVSIRSNWFQINNQLSLFKNSISNTGKKKYLISFVMWLKIIFKKIFLEFKNYCSRLT